jgi:hypothetical protein
MRSLSLQTLGLLPVGFQCIEREPRWKVAGPGRHANLLVNGLMRRGSVARKLVGHSVVLERFGNRFIRTLIH